MSVGPDEALNYPTNLPSLPDEHTTVFPPTPGSSAYRFFASSSLTGGFSGTVVLETTALSAAIERTLNELERTKFDVFPSGHTMIAVAVLLVAFRRARDVFRVLLPVAVLLVLSTVYCRYHYVVDVLAGIILAIATVPVGDAIWERLVGADR